MLILEILPTGTDLCDGQPKELCRLLCRILHPLLRLATRGLRFECFAVELRNPVVLAAALRFARVDRGHGNSRRDMTWR
jgi:hypothetical protein